MKPVRIATRGSELALWQANHVAGRIRAALGRETEIVALKSTGDRIQEVSLAKIGGKGLFVKEIEEALLDGRADLAVHSAKDLPAATPPELALIAFPERADPRDALVTRPAGLSIETLPRGARVGTGSARRCAQLRLARPDLEVLGLRGNVPTRLRKLEQQDLQAVVLACAGLDRLGLADRISERVEPRWLLPAVGQGVVAVEARRDDPFAAEAAHVLDHGPTARAVAAERGFLLRLGGDCNVPLAAFAELLPGDRLHLRGLVLDMQGRRVARGETEMPAERAAEAGVLVAEQVLGDGGEAILAELQAEAAS